MDCKNTINFVFTAIMKKNLLIYLQKRSAKLQQFQNFDNI
jgi:hypothetical protein